MYKYLESFKQFDVYQKNTGTRPESQQTLVPVTTFTTQYLFVGSLWVRLNEIPLQCLTEDAFLKHFRG